MREWFRAPATHRTVLFLALVVPLLVRVALGELDPGQAVREVAALALSALGAGAP